MQAVVELRRAHSTNFLTRPVVEVLIPVCDGCWSYDYHRFEREHRPPDISPDSLARRPSLVWCS